MGKAAFLGGFVHRGLPLCLGKRSGGRDAHSHGGFLCGTRRQAGAYGTVRISPLALTA